MTLIKGAIFLVLPVRFVVISPASLLSGVGKDMLRNAKMGCIQSQVALVALVLLMGEI